MFDNLSPACPLSTQNCHFYEKTIPLPYCRPSFFLTSILLPHKQLGAIIEGTTSLPDVTTVFLQFQPEGHWETYNKVGQ